jgi:hypothetical protein
VGIPCAFVLLFVILSLFWRYSQAVVLIQYLNGTFLWSLGGVLIYRDDEAIPESEIQNPKNRIVNNWPCASGAHTNDENWSLISYVVSKHQILTLRAFRILTFDVWTYPDPSRMLASRGDCDARQFGVAMVQRRQSAATLRMWLGAVLKHSQNGTGMSKNAQSIPGLL